MPVSWIARIYRQKFQQKCLLYSLMMHSAAVSSLFLHFKRTFEIGPSLPTYPPSNPALDGDSSCQLADFKNMLQLLLDNFTMMGKQARVSKNGTFPGLGSIKQLRVILVILPLPLCIGYRKFISEHASPWYLPSQHRTHPFLVKYRTHFHNRKKRRNYTTLFQAPR